MPRNIKIDLHTHPFQTLRERLGIKGIHEINKEAAGMIVSAIKEAGLDGIAITEYNNFNWGWVASLEIWDNFRQENLVILPGSETEAGGQQYLQIYIPEYARKRYPFFKGKEWFVILAHPGYSNGLYPDVLKTAKFDAVEGCSTKGRFDPAYDIAAQRGLEIVQASDAHRLEDLGLYYMELVGEKKSH
jgi:hypothetical protein